MMVVENLRVAGVIQNEHTERIFQYLARQFDAEPSKIASISTKQSKLEMVSLKDVVLVSYP